MSNVMKYGTLLVLAVAIAAMIAPAAANLAGTAFGFPTIVQNGQTTAFNRDTAAATDNEAVAIAFPTTNTDIDLPGMDSIGSVGGFGVSFPTIVQTAEQSQVLTHCDFATTTENAAFAYPFTTVGACGIPGFGFGF